MGIVAGAAATGYVVGSAAPAAALPAIPPRQQSCCERYCGCCNSTNFSSVGSNVDSSTLAATGSVVFAATNSGYCDNCCACLYGNGTCDPCLNAMRAGGKGCCDGILSCLGHAGKCLELCTGNACNLVRDGGACLGDALGGCCGGLAECLLSACKSLGSVDCSCLASVCECLAKTLCEVLVGFFK